MKKYIALFLSLILLMFCGCSQNKSDTEEVARTDYNVNDAEVIKIGVLTPSDNEVGNDVLEGIKFASEMASRVNIDKAYQLELSVCDLSDDIDLSAKKLIEEKVAAVICYGSDYAKTNSVIDSFKTSSTPLVFIDNNSKKIEENSTSFTISSAATYQASVLAAFMQSENYKNGVIIYEDNDYCKELSESYGSLFEENYGINTTSYKSAEDVDYNSIINGSEFVFVIGNNRFSQVTAKAIKEKSQDIPVILTEMYKSQSFENSLYNDCYFLSKFETDSENHYVTDFISVYSKMKDVTASEISAAIAYGYDSYMLIYGALGSLNPNSGASPLDSVKNGSADTKSVTITASQIGDALRKEGKVYDGVIDSIAFEKDGTFKPSYIFIDSVEGGSPYMLNKFVY